MTLIRSLRALAPMAATLLVATLAALPAPAHAERIKDLAQVAGVRGNPLVGYGLVVGLDGSGDRTSQTPFTPGGTPGNSDQATVKFTKCEAGDSGVTMEAQITNTTKEKRTYIVTGLAFDEAKKTVGSAALMVDNVEPGKSATATGKSDKAAKGKITCEASQIESMPSSS